MREIFSTAESLFKGKVKFDKKVVDQIVDLSESFPYFAQLIGKSSVLYGNEIGTNEIDVKIFDEVLDKIRTGKSLPQLEDQYQLAIGNSKERAMLLVLLAEQQSEAALYNEDIGNVVLQKTRSTAQALGIEYAEIGRRALCSCAREAR
jgi:hypothetical protein